ncbi:MAG: hypothetical protein KGJ57_18245 [Sphingomonadales bacterium]|nr:hypothetical protein [Sphingomonadales bacterium]MDE2171340.1 hypothetical protein [Sphingomonadales bacterium]
MTEQLLSTTGLTPPEANAPVLSRDPGAALPGELPRGAEIPDDLDPLAEGVLMKHQREWLEDPSDLKIAAKGRRTGITFAEALDDTLIAAASRAAGGDNVFYIGDTKDKGREFIGYVAHFARVVAKELVEIEEFLFKDEREDGTSKDISAYRVTFASGYRVEALSSRPENIRGLQGVVVIDEAAFHKNVRDVIDAVNALLIWGGKIRVISSHNGVLNPFNELIREAEAGKNPFKVHFIPFSAAVENGLFKRVCLMKGKPYSPEAEQAWEALIRGAYGTRLSKMRQELDGIPSDAEGAALSRVMIEQATIKDVPVVRLVLPDSFKSLPKPDRTRKTQEWLRLHVLPHLKGLDQKRRHDLGQDFARSGDSSDLIVQELGQDLVRRWRLVIEMRNVPFETQRDILFFVGEQIPRFGHGAFDATGNGAYLAEVAAQKWGERISEIKLSAGWYGENSPAYIEAIGDGSVFIAADDDVVRDHQALQYVNGVVRVPEDMRYKGSDGLDRHGDTAIAGILTYFASRQDGIAYGYEPVRREGGGSSWNRPDDHDDFSRDPYRPPLGARLRGGGVM